MKLCVALKKRIFSSEDKSLDPKCKILIYAPLFKIGNVAGCRSDDISCIGLIQIKLLLLLLQSNVYISLQCNVREVISR